MMEKLRILESGVDMAALASNLAVAQFAGRSDRLASKADTLDKQIKNNLQIDAGSELYQQLSQFVCQQIKHAPLMQSFALPLSNLL